MDEERQRNDARSEEQESEEQHPETRPSRTEESVREPMMEAPVAPAGGWQGVGHERSWNPAQGDRSFGYGADETAAPEPDRPGHETDRQAGKLIRPTDAEAPGE
jgi:hypothetical protein